MIGHITRWYGVVPGSGERIPRTRFMNGADWGWDAVCSCGWESRTGGAIQERIRDAIAEHRRDVRLDETPGTYAELRETLAELGLTSASALGARR